MKILGVQCLALFTTIFDPFMSVIIDFVPDNDFWEVLKEGIKELTSLAHLILVSLSAILTWHQLKKAKKDKNKIR